MTSKEVNNANDDKTAIPVDFDPFASGKVASTAPATEPQQEIWTAARIDAKASCAFNAPLLLWLRGEVQYTELLAAYSKLIDRHDALRGSFSPDGNSFVVSESIAVDLPLLEIPGKDSESKLKSLDDIVETANATPFNLEFGPLIRGQLLKFSDREYYLLIMVHHIVCDGWSTGILLRELGELYCAEMGVGSLNLPPAPSFVDYAWELHANRNSESYVDSRNYWLAQYSDGAPVLELPLDKSRPTVRSFNASRQDCIINAERSKAINQLAARSGNTLFTTLFAIFQIFISRRSGQSDLVIGFPAASQPISGNVGLVGHCVNLLPIRSRLDAKNTFLEHLETLKPRIYDALEHQEFTFGSLLKELRIPRDYSRIPLVPVIFNVESYADEIRFCGPEAKFISRARSSETFELFLNVVSHTDKMELQCSYNSDLFSSELITKMMAEFECLVDDITSSPDQVIQRLSYVTKSDIDLIARWNNEARFEHEGYLINQMFENTAREFADKTAVICGTQALTYQQLDARANQLAHLLFTKGIKPGDFVGLYIDRSVGMLVAVLGVLKSGAAYVPLDPGYPRERIDYIRTTASIKCFITEKRLEEELSLAVEDILIRIDDDEPFQNMAGQSVNVDVEPESLAYTIFTSGSTGKPKGVQVPHRAVANLIPYVKELFSFTDQDVLLAVSTLCFDISVPELLLPIISGGVLIVADHDEVLDGNKLAQLIDSHKVSLLDATPSTWRLLLGSGWQGNAQLTAISTGEPLPRDLAEQLVAKAGDVWNMYGPTETTVWSTCYRITDPQQPILIGKPIGNTQCYVLDDAEQIVPIGVPGELFIGGDGVTNGYLNREDLTAERYIEDIFSEEPGRRLYRTGDLVRWRADGNLEYLKRMDNQVKVRGFRIELEEIETVLASHEAVKQCVVDVREDRPEDQRLVAYVVLIPGTELTITEMRQHARTQLPNYMVPQHLIEIDTLPLLPNGKVDRKSLPTKWGVPAHAVDQLEEPETEAEIYLASIWQQELGGNSFSVHDNFFDIGGHSLLAAQIVLRIEKERGCQIPLRAMIVNTLGQIAHDYLENSSASEQRNDSNESRQASIWSPSKFKKLFGVLARRK